jgi:ribosomal-protein-alanine N-acetyltransferase
MIAEGLETERLRFERLEKRHKAEWKDFFTDPDAVKFLTFDSSDPDLCDKWFAKQWRRYERGEGGLCVIVDKKSGKVVGQCGLLVQEIDGVIEWEVGYHVLPEYRGKGYASEAAQAVKQFGFQQQVSDHIISTIHVENIGSQRVAMRNGMKVWKRTIYKDLPVQIWRQDLADYINC